MTQDRISEDKVIELPRAAAGRLLTTTLTPTCQNPVRLSVNWVLTSRSR